MESQVIYILKGDGIEKKKCVESHGRLLPAETWHRKKGCMEDHIHLLKGYDIEKKKKEMYGKLSLQKNLSAAS